MFKNKLNKNEQMKKGVCKIFIWNVNVGLSKYGFVKR